MSKKLSLSAYVKKRNGVPLGARDSLSNMLRNSLGAASFAQFWHYWNPIWGYYLSTKVMKPLRQIVPLWLATLLTFAVSGALHDLAIILLKGEFILICTPWFALMGLLVVITNGLNFSYSRQPWLTKALLNLSFIVLPLALALQSKQLFFG